MKRPLRLAVGVFGGLLLLAAAVPFFIDANRFRPELESRLSQALRRGVQVGSLKLALFSGGVTANDLTIADDPAFGQAPFLEAKSLHVGVDLAALIFSRQLIVKSLTIDQPEVRMLQAPSGQWNFSSLGVASSSPSNDAPAPSRPNLAVNLVRISAGRFTVGRTAGHLKPLVLENVTGELRDFAPEQTFPFSLDMKVAGGGSLKLAGKAGPLDSQDVALTPASITLKVEQLDVAGSGLNEIAPDFAGLVSFDGGGESGASGVDLRGKLTIDKWKLASKGRPAKRTLELDFHVKHDWKSRAGTVEQADVHIGKAVVKLTGKYVPEGESLALQANLTGREMPVEELAQMLPALGISLPNGSSLQGGTAVVEANISGPVGRLVTSGSVHVTSTRLAGFNLANRLSGIERLAGIKGGPDTDVQELYGTVKMGSQGIEAGEIRLILPALGDVTGAGKVNPDDTLNFRMQALVHTGGVAAVLRGTPVPFTVDGTSREPAFHPDLKGVVAGEVKGVGRTAEGALKDLVGGRK